MPRPTSTGFRPHGSAPDPDALSGLTGEPGTLGRPCPQSGPTPPNSPDTRSSRGDSQRTVSGLRFAAPRWLGRRRDDRARKALPQAATAPTRPRPTCGLTAHGRVGRTHLAVAGIAG